MKKKKDKLSVCLEWNLPKRRRRSQFEQASPLLRFLLWVLSISIFVMAFYGLLREFI